MSAARGAYSHYTTQVTPSNPYHLQLGLPLSIVSIARCLDPPYPQDLQHVEDVLADYANRLAMVRTLIQLEKDNPHSPIPERLLEVAMIAQRRVDACTGLRAAWRSLPLELWDKIFGYYLRAIRSGPSQGTVEATNRPAHTAPLTFSSVCRAWQVAVKSSNSVWTDLVIPIEVDLATGVPFLAARDASHILPRLNRFVAKHVPWSLTISSWGESDVTGATPVSLPSTTFPLAPLLEHHPSLTWVSDLCIIGPNLSTRLDALSFPSATSLMVLPCKTRPKIHLDNTLPQVHSIKKAVLVGVLDRGYFTHNLPWSQLTHLYLGGALNLPGMRQVLRSCTHFIKHASRSSSTPIEK